MAAGFSDFCLKFSRVSVEILGATPPCRRPPFRLRGYGGLFCAYFAWVLGASRLRKHIIYVVLWLRASKNIGSVAFWGPKTQPNHGFGGSEASKSRNLQWFGGSGTKVLRLRRLVSKVSWQNCHKMDLPGFEPGTFGNASLRNRCHNH